MNELAVANNNLPSNIEDLSKFVLVGREQLVAVRAAIRAIDKVGVAQEVRKQKLKEGQEMGTNPVRNPWAGVAGGHRKPIKQL